MHRILQWLQSINWKTRLISIIIFLVSILMSSVIYVFFIHLQSELIDTNLRFFRDFSSLFGYELTDLMQKNDNLKLKNLAEKVYLTTSSIDYLQIFDDQGYLLLSFPSNNLFFQPIHDFHSQILSLKYDISCFSSLNSSNSFYIKNSQVNCFLPLFSGHKLLGFLQLGLRLNNSILYISKFTQNVSSILFVIIWLIFLLGAIANFLIIIEPVGELSKGIRNVSFGNFGYKIQLFSGGLFGNLIVNFNEMSERLQYYERNNITQLTSEKAKLESFLFTITDGAILLDTELRILLVNQIALKFFQWSNKDLIGSIISQHLPPHINEELLPIFNSMIKSNCFDNNNMQLRELTISFNNDSFKAFRFLLSTISSYNYQCFSGIVIIIQDITIEQQLNDAKNQFISNVSHELRTPLCNIGSFLETLIDYKYKLTVHQKEQFLEIAYAETQRLNSLVNDILDLSRLESECSYVLKPIALIKTIVYIAQASQIIALNKQVQILFEIHPGVQKIFAHQNSLCQVLSNLISNSLKFTHKQGRIIVRVYPILANNFSGNFSDRHLQVLRLEIIDEGIGIQKMFQKQIFDRFVRIENNIHTLQGTGLGLSIVQNIIKKHNSTINVYSEVNIGTSFWFDLFVAP